MRDKEARVRDLQDLYRHKAAYLTEFEGTAEKRLAEHAASAGYCNQY